MLIRDRLIAIVIVVMTQLRIDKPVVDVYGSPNPRGGRVNQLLFNEVVAHLGTRGDFIRIRGSDGYEGWIRMDQSATNLPARLTHLVDVPTAALLDERTGRIVGRLSFGTRILILEKDASFGLIGFGGKSALISMGCVRTVIARRLSWQTLRTYLDNLVGTPYFWGGRSGFGVDCSGLVQLIYNSCGYDLPRDSSDQRKRGRRVSVKSLKQGDLIFSPGHVCVYYGAGRIIHSSARAGGVYLENLLSDTSDSRTDIRSKVEMVKRVI